MYSFVPTVRYIQNYSTGKLNINTTFVFSYYLPTQKAEFEDL